MGDTGKCGWRQATSRRCKKKQKEVKRNHAVETKDEYGEMLGGDRGGLLVIENNSRSGS